MKICCIGWGSLIWDKRTLNVQGAWDTKGPTLPIEFTRISRDGRVTLIIDEKARPVTTLWNLSAYSSMAEAKENLREREDTRPQNIHSIQLSDKPVNPIQQEIHTWLFEEGLDAAIWTGLSYSSRTNNVRPSISDILNHFQHLTGESLAKAKEYVQRAPLQIVTDYRVCIERELGWFPI